jgi:hypothetical protein
LDKPGRSPSLEPLGGWDIVTRGRFEATHGGHVWTLDVSYFDFAEKLRLYRDGSELEVKKSPVPQLVALALRFKTSRWLG